MATPSNLQGCIELTSTNPTLIGYFSIQGFVVNPTATNFWARIEDTNALPIFEAFGSALNTVTMPLPKSLNVINLSLTASANIKSVLVYTE